MVMRASCRSEDSAWTRSFFNSTATTRHSSGSLSFSQKYYYSMNSESVRSLSSTYSGGDGSIKTMFDGLEAKIGWMEKWR